MKAIQWEDGEFLAFHLALMYLDATEEQRVRYGPAFGAALQRMDAGEPVDLSSLQAAVRPVKATVARRAWALAKGGMPWTEAVEFAREVA